MRVGVMGTGYVGLVTGVCLAEMGHDVVCQDVLVDKIAKLERGEIPIYEPGLEDLVKRNKRDGRLRFSTDPAVATTDRQVTFIAVGTPPDEDGSADRRYVVAAARAIATAMAGPLVVVVKSTVPVGTCDMVAEEIATVLAARGVDFPYDVVSNPEFLKEGAAIEDFMRPDRIVVGVSSERGRQVMEELYNPFVRNGHPILVMSRRSSELTKYASNAMLATRISLMNEISRICDRVGADVMDIRKGMGSDKRIGMAFLYPGPGYGGSCFPKDVQALGRVAAEAGTPSDLLDAVEKVNRNQKMLLAHRVIERFGDLRGKRVCLWGLAFKPDTDDIRQAPALTIAKRLTEVGAEIVAFDPEAAENTRHALRDNPRVSFAADPYAAAVGADVIVLVTEWRVFRGIDLQRVRNDMRDNVFFDGRNLYEPATMRELGFEYHAIGRGCP